MTVSAHRKSGLVILDEDQVLGGITLAETRWWLTREGFRNSEQITVPIIARGTITSVLVWCGSFTGTPLAINVIGNKCNPGDDLRFLPGDLSISIEPPLRA